MVHQNNVASFLNISLRPYWWLLSLIVGALTTLAFAPFDLSGLVFVTLAIAFYFWNKLPAKQAAFNAWLFGLGLQCSGVSWIYYSLHVHGSAPVIFAVILVFLLCCYLSLYTALSVYVINRFLPGKSAFRFILFYPASWIIFEWLQGYVMTGFAWMQLGYTQIDYPLSGYAPIFGNHAVSGLIALTAGGLVLFASRTMPIKSRAGIAVVSLIFISWSSAAWFKTVNWTQADGEALTVSVMQGNIPQQDKWKTHMRPITMQRYRALSLTQTDDVDLIVWPETAVPDYQHRIGPFVEQLKRDMKGRDTELLFGLFVRSDEGRLLNSVMTINGDVYHKRHLVPLGEYIPLRFLIEFFNRFVKIPMSDIASGDDEQPLLTVKGVPLGVSICFEEAFSRDVIGDLPKAKILLNVSNDAWFEDSIEPHQHHAIARMRALEAGRYMVRSTNTGITSFIGPHGEVIQRLPQFKVAVLKGEIQPMSGATPFVRWGDAMILILSVLLLSGFALQCYRRKVAEAEF